VKNEKAQKEAQVETTIVSAAPNTTSVVNADAVEQNSSEYATESNKSSSEESKESSSASSAETINSVEVVSENKSSSAENVSANISSSSEIVSEDPIIEEAISSDSSVPEVSNNSTIVKDVSVVTLHTHSEPHHHHNEHNASKSETEHQSEHYQKNDHHVNANESQLGNHTHHYGIDHTHLHHGNHSHIANHLNTHGHDENHTSLDGNHMHNDHAVEPKSVEEPVNNVDALAEKLLTALKGGINLSNVNGSVNIYVAIASNGGVVNFGDATSLNSTSNDTSVKVAVVDSP